MALIDTLLSLGMGTEDCLYRLRRDLPSTSTVIYIHPLSLSLIPTDSLTYGLDLIRNLGRTVPDWDNEAWTTLTVSHEDGAVKAVRDEWAPHFLPVDANTRELPRINVLDLEVVASLKNRVSRVCLPGRPRTRILKICPFAYQLRYLEREFRAYEKMLNDEEGWGKPWGQ
ncbi:hypothetical protein V499_08151 [Pseudogymnoascus sp. VKM F-103]|nr:hypothetical protein V499_08151 [Pseudogymnoascus sp. VKM F-103]